MTEAERQAWLAKLDEMEAENNEMRETMVLFIKVDEALAARPRT